MAGGLINVASTAIIGKQGSGTLNISGGQFTAGSLITAPNASSSAVVSISGDAVVDLGLLTVGSGAKLNITGYNTDIQIGGMATAQGSTTTFGFDGGAAVGAGILSSGPVWLNGKIEITFTGARVDGTYTIIRSETSIDDKTSGNLIDTPFCSYEIVDGPVYKELRVTVTTPQNCQELISAGGKLSGDINGDCKVNFADFAKMAEQWLWCNDPLSSGCDWTLANN
jgi:hypothetical protein